MKQIDNRQKELKQLKAQKGHLLSFRDKSHVHIQSEHVAKPGQKKDQADSEAPASAVPAQPHLKIGRNDPCPCGSGKKYKKCCLLKNESPSSP